MNWFCCILANFCYCTSCRSGIAGPLAACSWSVPCHPGQSCACQRRELIEEMSQGQKKRVALAKSLTEEASLYLWDEPANYLDLFNQDQLIKLLAKEQLAMLLVDHDQAFIEVVAKERVNLRPVL